MPAAASAAEFTHIEWPSDELRAVGVLPVMASRSSFRGCPGGNVVSAHPPPISHAREDWATAQALIAFSVPSAVGRSFRLHCPSSTPALTGCTCAS